MTSDPPAQLVPVGEGRRAVRGALRGSLGGLEPPRSTQEGSEAEDAARKLQAAFRAKRERHRLRLAFARFRVFGSAALDGVEGADRLGGRGSTARERQGRAAWKPDREFRQTLENNLVSGCEDLYIWYAAVEDYVAWDSQIRFLSVGSLPPRENPRQNGSEALRRGADPGLTEELLPASDGLRCVLKLREELERVDGTFTRAVENFILVVSMLRAEAAHKRASIVQREDARARETIDKLRKGVHAGLKAALEDLYKQSFILMQASSLNYVGFRKLQIRIEESFGGKLSLGGGRPAREEFRSRPFFLQSSDEAPESTKAFFSAITEVEGIYANLFTCGDVQSARAHLRSFKHPPPEHKQILIVGAQLGAVVVLLAWAIWLLLVSPPEYLECPFCTDYLMATLPVFRILLVPAVGLWTWALCVYVWEKKNINYKYILMTEAFRFPGVLSNFKNAALLSIVELAAFAVYVGALRTGTYPAFLGLPPTAYPLLLLVGCLAYGLWPGIRGCVSAYFWVGVAQTAVRPLGQAQVSFRENFIADILTSMVVVLRDIANAVGFYACGGAVGLPTKEVPEVLRLVQGPLITAIPYWWRFMQCMRRCYDAPSPRQLVPQLVNSGKYFISLTSISMAAVGCEHGCRHFYFEMDKWTAGRITWFSALVLGTIFAYLWDILMDWSLVEKDERGARCFRGLLPALRLRKRRELPTWFYYWAALSNLGGRLLWALSVSPYSNIASPQAMTTLVAVVEMLRRGQWSMLRIENEYLNNASAYREVADVPVLLTFSEAVPEEKPARAGPQSTGLRLRHRSVCLISTFMVAMAAYVIFVAALGFNKGKL